VASKEEILVRLEGFRNAIDAFLTDPGEIPLLKIRKEYLKRNHCPLLIGLGTAVRSWGGNPTKITSPLADSNPMVLDFHNRMQQEVQSGGSYSCAFCNICPVSVYDKKRCGIDEYYSKARSRMAYQQGLKARQDKPSDSDHKETLANHRNSCSDIMSICIAGFIELSAVITSILHGEECTNA